MPRPSNDTCRLETIVVRTKDKQATLKRELRLLELSTAGTKQALKHATRENEAAMSRLKEHKARHLRLIALPTEILIQIAGHLLPPFTSVQTMDPARQTTEDLDSFIDDETVEGHRDLNALEQTCQLLSCVVYKSNFHHYAIARAPLRVSFMHPRSSFPTNTALSQISERHWFLARFQCVEIVTVVCFARVPKPELRRSRDFDRVLKKLTIKVGRTREGSGWRVENVQLETLEFPRRFDNSILDLAWVEERAVRLYSAAAAGGMMSLREFPVLGGYQMLCTVVNDVVEFSEGLTHRGEWFLLPTEDFVTFKDRPAADDPIVACWSRPGKRLGWIGKRPSPK
ncbi:unnamed protein product [Zymoseptoria tritici ST99CH_1A5]|uniref:Uncharacterized protein n=1 Tax=Zymoseptoria tritici ST99CH_1A5 TaxID=1276529 RepID=A0A1Y6LQA6_ZYMTR|nr:unnamed protein product [Zymoseptoria tritici ST99CH_1A5]